MKTKQIYAPLEFTPDKWVRVRTDTAESARKFFGAPDGWPVERDGTAPGGCPVFKVLADGLKIT